MHCIKFFIRFIAFSVAFCEFDYTCCIHVHIYKMIQGRVCTILGEKTFLRWHCFNSASNKLESEGKHCLSLLVFHLGRDPTVYRCCILQ